MGQVSTIASWIDYLSPDSLKYKTCEPRKVGLPILSSKSCTNYLFESQGCVGVIGLPSVLCKVIQFFFLFSFSLIFYFLLIE